MPKPSTADEESCQVEEQLWDWARPVVGMVQPFLRVVRRAAARADARNARRVAGQDGGAARRIPPGLPKPTAHWNAGAGDQRRKICQMARVDSALSLSRF